MSVKHGQHFFMGQMVNHTDFFCDKGYYRFDGWHSLEICKAYAYRATK